LGLLLCAAPAFAADDGYDFPFDNPYLATILGTPTAQEFPLVKHIPVKLIDLTMFPERKYPDIFWYNDQLRCSVVAQKGKAPLIFVIAGTGAGFNSDKMLSLQSIFYRAGFHVVNISSPTHANFVAAASTTSAPGMFQDDARDLYRVMQKVMEEIKGDVEVSEFYLTGYSLGGAQAAFVSLLDEQEKAFNFAKVLMINPPVSLYTSATLFDRMITEDVPGGSAGIGLFLRAAFTRLAEVYKQGDFVKFDHEFLFNILRYAKTPPKDENMKALIGISFRISAMNMIFATDLMTDSGYVVPKGLNLDNNDNLDIYFKTISYVPFISYLDELLLPISQAQDPQMTRQKIIDGVNIASIESYLRKATKIGCLTNVDDIILDPGQIDYLRDVFGERGKFYPRGGHCGNINHLPVAEYMTAFFKRP
jgi:hypothetical protein